MLILEVENYYRRMVFGGSDYEDAARRPALVIEY